MRKIKFKFSRDSVSKLILITLKYKYLLFFIFFSAFSAFAFEFTYKYIYVDTNFLEYEESYESRVMLGIKANDRILKEILKNIEYRNERLKKENIDYNNPFEFTRSEASETNEANNIDNNAGNSGNNDFTSLPPLIAP